MSPIFAGEALALTALLLFSCNIILTKAASARLALNVGYLVSVVSNVLFAAALTVLMLALRDEPLRWDWPGALLYAAAGVFTTYLGRWFFFEAIARLGPAKASIFQVSSPVFTVVIAWIALGQALDARAMVSIGVAMIGLALVSVSPRDLLRRAARRDAARAGATASTRAVAAARGDATQAAARARPRAWQSLLRSGLMVGAGSSAAYAVGNTLRGAGIQRWDEPIVAALLGAIAGLAFHLALTPGNAEVLRALRGARRSGVLLFAISGAMTISAQTCAIAAMRYVPVAVVAMVTLCTPLLVFPLSYWLLRNQEGITSRTLAGGAVALAGIAALILR